MVMVYAYDPPELAKKDVYHQVLEDLERVGFKDLSLYQHKRWLQSPHVSPEILSAGFYDKLRSMQGYGQVYLAGEIMSTVTMDNSIRYSRYFVDKYF